MRTALKTKTLNVISGKSYLLNSATRLFFFPLDSQFWKYISKLDVLNFSES